MTTEYKDKRLILVVLLIREPEGQERISTPVICSIYDPAFTPRIRLSAATQYSLLSLDGSPDFLYFNIWRKKKKTLSVSGKAS